MWRDVKTRYSTPTAFAAAIQTLCSTHRNDDGHQHVFPVLSTYRIIPYVEVFFLPFVELFLIQITK